MSKIFNIETYPWKANINYRKHPEYYRVGKGEQGVLICNPYKKEILPFWKFKLPSEAKISASQIYNLFLHYLNNNDFIGADMARKFLQMGFTRARRYFNYKGGRKYLSSGEVLTKGTGEPIKAKSAAIFYKKWRLAENDKKYKRLKQLWKKIYG